MTQIFRYYQIEADDGIYEELHANNKCLVKMFCGTGKSILMRRCKIVQNKKLVVYVFPSLSLIKQFNSDYLGDYPSENVLCVSSDSSENGSTTDPNQIMQFIHRPQNLIVCVTYNSFKTLIDNLGSHRISVCIFDESHHAVGKTYQQYISDNDVCDKQIFFTATPKNANGVVMYDRDHPETGMCGKLVYDYSYLRGVNEGYLNPFEIRIDMFIKNINKSIFESIARAMLSSGNYRCLTFHSDVNTERDTSVLNFVNDAELKQAEQNSRI
jgi:superfamily II DNA or RNA helicase